MDCIKGPLGMEDSLLQMVLISCGVTNVETQVNIIHENETVLQLATNMFLQKTVSSFSSPLKSYNDKKKKYSHIMIASVGAKIIAAARLYVDEQLTKAIEAAKQDLPDDLSPSQIQALLQQDKQVQEWMGARARICGEREDPVPWKYVIIDDNNHTDSDDNSSINENIKNNSPPLSPNAFVTEILPFRLFITASMLNIATTADELAIIIGHEVSHLLLGHNSESNILEAMLRTLEIVLLSIDPTAGVISLGVIGALAAARSALSASYSRECEWEADALGLELAARACFDTPQGSIVMHKMNQQSVSTEPESLRQQPAIFKSGSIAIGRLYDSHPPSLERYENMKTLSESTLNANQYNHCASVQSNLYNALWNRNEKDDTGDGGGSGSRTNDGNTRKSWF